MKLVQPRMKVLRPLRTLDGFCRAFDNGGHFWSVWSHVGDGIITVGEIAKAGPSLVACRTAILYFELLRGFLSEAEAKDALAALDWEALARWKRYKPARCSPAEALAKPPGTAVIVESEPIRAYDKEGDGISVLRVITTGKITIAIPVPIAQQFRLWRLDDGQGSRRSALTLLAAQPKKLDLSGRKLSIGAFVHESETKPRTGKAKRRCLMGVAACPLQG